MFRALQRDGPAGIRARDHCRRLSPRDLRGEIRAGDHRHLPLIDAGDLRDNLPSSQRAEPDALWQG